NIRKPDRSTAPLGKSNALLPWPARTPERNVGSWRVASPHREVEIGIGERLTAEREVPPLLVIGLEAAALHGVREQRAVLLRLGAHAGVRQPRLRAEEVERRAHVDVLRALRSPTYERQVNRGPTRMAGAGGDVVEPEQVALVDVGIVHVLARHVVEV